MMVYQGAQDLPDPIITANIYCSGLLDSVICQAVAPFSKTLRETADRNGIHYLWFVRYSKRGEHLKVRIHGPQNTAAFLKEELSSIVSQYLESLTGASTTVAADGDDAPAIDVEDGDLLPHPDRSFIWTQYRRSNVSFGSEPFLLDDRYVALLTRALGYASEFIVNEFPSEPEESIEKRQRQKILLGLAIPAIGVLDPALRCRYISYHRNWLLRFLVVKRLVTVLDPDALVGRLNARASQMRTAISDLRRVALQSWVSYEESGDASRTVLFSWLQSIDDLAAYVNTFRHRQEYSIDPFSDEVSFPCLFKALHGSANQLGISLLEEAFVYHLLLHAVHENADEERLPLTPFHLGE